MSRNSLSQAALATAATAAMIISLSLSGCSRTEPPPSQTASSLSKAPQPADLALVPKPVSPSQSYVGSQVCSECHAETAERYFRSAMGRSLSKVAAAPAPHEDYEHTTSFVRGNRLYRVEKDGEDVWHHESISDDEGVIYDQGELVQYAIGSNTRGRSYLLWRDGLIFMSPISWYAREGWDLSPTYEADRHIRFSRRITEACIVCHSGRAVTEPGREHVFPQPVFLEESIGCERCHGPGAEHVSFRRNNPENGQDPLLKLAELPSAERDAVCFQCHFQGEERILRYGRSETDFRPGMKFSDIWTAFIKGTGTDGSSTMAVSQAMQMQSSKCFQMSAGRLGCVSCHDPHGSPAPSEQSGYFNHRCLSCHEERGCVLPSEKRLAEPASGSCIYCHMPALSASNIPHTSQTDHRIPRRSDEEKSTSARKSFTMFLEADAHITEIEKTRAEGLLMSLIAEKTRDRDAAERSVQLLQRALKSMPDDEALQQALGGVLLLSGRDAAAETLSRQMIQTFPKNEVAYLRLANSAHDAGRYDEAESFFSPFMKLNPWIAVTHGRRAHALGMLNRFDQAFEQADQALKLDPTILPLYNWLANAHERLGDLQKSDYYKQQAKRLAKRLATSPVR